MTNFVSGDFMNSKIEFPEEDNAILESAFAKFWENEEVCIKDFIWNVVVCDCRNDAIVAQSLHGITKAFKKYR